MQTAGLNPAAQAAILFLFVSWCLGGHLFSSDSSNSRRFVVIFSRNLRKSVKSADPDFYQFRVDSWLLFSQPAIQECCVLKQSGHLMIS